MATVVADRVKDALMARGLWGDFLRRRDDIKLERGCGALNASREAMGEFVAQGKVPAEFADMLRGRGRPRKSVVGGGASMVAGGTLADARRAGRDERAAASETKAVAASVPAASADGVTSAVFAGKSCSFLKAFMWAYENVRFDDARAEDAPSAVAWNLMQDMRSSPSLRADLARAALTKSIAKSDEDENGGSKFDGEAEYDLLAAIAEGGAV